MTLISSLAIIFGIISLGIVCGRKKLFNSVQIEGFELFLFKIAIPCYLFSSTLKSNFNDLVDFPYITSYLLSFISVSSVIILYYWYRNSLSDILIKILAISYVNAGLYSIPIITFILGEPKAAILSNMVQVIVIQSIFLTILSLLYHRQKSITRRLLVTILNPLIIMPTVGLFLSFYQIEAPAIIASITKSLGYGASSMALFTFGLSLSDAKINKNNMNGNLIFGVLCKNILHPLISFIIGRYLFNLDTYWLASLVIITSAPSALIVLYISKQFGAQQNFVKSTIAATSVVSLVSLVIISFLSQFYFK